MTDIQLQEAVDQLLATKPGPSLSTVLDGYDALVGRWSELGRRVSEIEDEGPVEDIARTAVENYVEGDEFERAVEQAAERVIERELETFVDSREFSRAVEAVISDETFQTERDVEEAVQDGCGQLETELTGQMDKLSEQIESVSEHAVALDARLKQLTSLTFGQRLRWLLTGALPTVSE